MAALIAPWLVNSNSNIGTGPSLTPPSSTYLFGTDELGTDLFALVFHGARTSLLIGISVALLAGAGGGVVGIMAGTIGGMFDRLFMRFADMTVAMADIPVMIVMAAFFGPGLGGLTVMLSLFSWVFPARITRSRVHVIKEMDFILSAKAHGGGVLYLTFRHYIPETIPLLSVSMIQVAGRAITAEAGLALLGLGDPSSGSWGMTIHHALGFPSIYYTDYWKWWLVFPWLFLTLTITSLAFIGRDLERIANPKGIRR